MYNLAYRALFTTGDLSHEGGPTGVLYGVFREIVKVQEKFGTHLSAFAFDLGKSRRSDQFDWYKSTRRKNRDPKKGEVISVMKEQIESLRRNYLEQLGYPNILYQEGMEADDIMASACDYLNMNQDAILVSGDEDLYQLLSNRISIYQPRSQQYLTKEKFVREYCISPHEWIQVKAIAGCVSDDIPGIKGVGEKTAIKWIRNKIQHAEIDKWVRSKQYKINMELVALPHPETKKFKLTEHKPPTKEAWMELMDKLGMASMADHDPSAASRHLFSGW